jgi:chemotaxis protein histidine kinase CheA
MTSKAKQEPQNPLILRCHRIIEAFAKSDDERDFYLDKKEGFLLYCNLDKNEEDLVALEEELKTNSVRYCLIPKFSFYETKKIMEGFVNEKVYDIDTKEKLLDIIGSREARENFLEFIQDHHAEFEKWQQYYQERSRIRIIEWLRSNHFHFVFEEDLDLPPSTIEKLKRNLFETKVGKDIITARKALSSKAKTYYSNEALNPRPKRGRPPKQAVKQEVETQFATDLYLSLTAAVRPFLFSPDTNMASVASFSSRFDQDEEAIPLRKTNDESPLDNISQQLSALRNLSSRWLDNETSPAASAKSKKPSAPAKSKAFDDEEEDEEYDDDDFIATKPKAKAAPKKNDRVVANSKANSANKNNQINKSKALNSTKSVAPVAAKKPVVNKASATSKAPTKKPPPKPASKPTAKPAPKPPAKPAVKASAASSKGASKNSAKAAPVKKGGLRSILKSKAPAKKR